MAINCEVEPGVLNTIDPMNSKNSPWARKFWGTDSQHKEWFVSYKSNNCVFHFNKFLDTNNPSMRNVDNKGNGKKKKITVEIVATTVMASLLMTPAMLTLVLKDFCWACGKKKTFLLDSFQLSHNPGKLLLLLFLFLLLLSLVKKN